MKVITAMVLSAVPIFALAHVAAANPPSALDLHYNDSRQELEVLIQHPVTDPQDHYIQEVTVLKNGQEMANRKFTSQTSHRNQTLTPVQFPAIEGDAIEVRAACNQSGSGSQSITVGKPQRPPRG